MRAARAVAAALGLLLVSLVPAAFAQEVHVRVDRGPHHAGLPIDIQVIAEGFEEEPEPQVSLPPPARGHLELLGVSPNVSSSIHIVQGRVTQRKSVQFVYRYRYVSAEPGRVVLGPFRVTQGNVSESAAPVTLEVLPVRTTQRTRVRLVLPEGPIYVGARTRVSLELWLEEQFEKRVHGYLLRAPFFDHTEAFRFLDEPDATGEIKVALETASGTLELRGEKRSAERGGQRFVVIHVERTAVPLHAGRYTVEPASVIVDEAIRWRRDLFGRRRATHVTKWRASDRPRELRVLPLPTAGRPESFAGAVGRGFTLEVSADRTVVQVGEPITLTLTVRGEGNLETLGFPRLDAEGLLPSERFRVPEGSLTGVEVHGGKRFTAVVRVLDESVREIPPLSYAWFDPELGRYQSTRSRPVALAVRPAHLVGAGDVVSRQKEVRSEEGLPAAEGSPWPLTGADLSIETRTEPLLRSMRSAPAGDWWVRGGYAGSALLLALAFLDRRRRLEDPEVRRRHRALRDALEKIRAARGLPSREAAAEVARALRRMIAELPAARDAELEALLAESDARSYAPARLEPAASEADSLVERALALGRRIIERAGG